MDADIAEYERKTFAMLQTRLRRLEEDTEVYRSQAQWEINKQEKEIERLLMEQSNLQKELGVNSGSSDQNPDQENVDRLRALSDHSQTLDEQLQSETQKQRQIKTEISNMELKLAELKKGGAKPNDRVLEQRRVKLLEVKLPWAETQFNKQISENREHREELQEMLSRRSRFQRLYKSRNEELQEVRKQIKEVTEQLLATCEASTEVFSKRTEMGERRRERAEYNDEMQRLQMIKTAEGNQREFQVSKCKRRGTGARMGHRQETSEERPSNVPVSHTREVLGVLTVAGAVGFIFAILHIILLIKYRMKKMDEGSDNLRKKSIYKKAPTTEAYV